MRPLDLSIVAGAMQKDILNFTTRTAGKILADSRRNRRRIQRAQLSPHVELELSVQALLGDQYLQPDTKKPGTRKAVGQSSSELRLVVEF